MGELEADATHTAEGYVVGSNPTSFQATAEYMLNTLLIQLGQCLYHMLNICPDLTFDM